MLQHLGAGRREWTRDLGMYPETDDYIECIASGVDTELQSYDFPEMLRQHDQLLIELLEASMAVPTRATSHSTLKNANFSSARQIHVKHAETAADAQSLSGHAG